MQVEDLILESMQKGEFNKLPGAGKPLPHEVELPGVDGMTAKLNKILINNGFVPEWITAEKDLRETKGALRGRYDRLLVDFDESLRSGLWTQAESEAWETRDRMLRDQLALVNRDIDRLNLIVPVLDRQQFHLSHDKELRRARERAEMGESVPPPRQQPPKPEYSEPSGVLRSLLDAFKAKS